MIYKQYIEEDFVQDGSVCVLASYANIIIAFSKSKYTVKTILGKYAEFFKIVPEKVKKEKAKSGERNFRIFYQNEIGNHFNNFCHSYQQSPIHGYEFIKIIHNLDLLNTKSFCKIIDYKAQPIPIQQAELTSLKIKLTQSEQLCLVTYPSGNGNCHSVLTGFDGTDFFVKDSERNVFDNRDFFSNPLITEYLLFEKS